MRVTKWLIITLVLLLCNATVFSQQLSLGNAPYIINKAAVLELNSDKQGLLFPRISDTAVINALTPPDGMVIYFIPDKQLLLRSNGAWKAMSFASSLNNYWSISGNSNGSEKKFGTADNFDLPFITNNLERLRITAAGNVGIAKNNPAEKLDVTGNVRFSGALMPGGSAGTLGHVLVSAGAGATPTWQDGTAYIANTAWMQGGNNLSAQRNFGTSSNYALPFITNNVERMRLTAAGFLGIGTTSPSTALHVFGTDPLTLTGVQTGTTTAADSMLTITNGLVRKLPVSTFQSQLNGSGFVKATGSTISYDNNTYTIANSAITGATKTKITYDSKGLVTGGTDATTSDIAEGANLYFTDARAREAALTGLSTATATSVTATDNILSGIGKLQGQINSLPTNATALLKANNLSDLSNAAAARTNLGATTVGSGFFTLTNPSAITFPRINADNSVSALDAASFRTSIGAGTGNGSVTSASIVSANGFAGTVATASSTPAITLSTTVTGLLKGNGTAISAAAAGTDYVVPNAAITGATKTKITYDSKGLVTAGADATTTDIAEGTNQYFTQARVRTTPLTGYTVGTNTTLAATDDVLTAMGKIQAQINAKGAGTVSSFSSGSLSPLFSTSVANAGTTPALSFSLSNAAATSVFGNFTNLSAAPSYNAATADGQFLVRRSGALTFGTIAASDIPTLNQNTTGSAASVSGTNVITNTNLRQSAGLSVLGNAGAVTANVADISGTADQVLRVNGAGSALGFGTIATGGIANSAVTYAKLQNVSANNRLLGRATTGAGTVEEITIGSGLTLTGTTLSATASANQWNTIGNSGVDAATNFLGTIDDKPMILKSFNQSFLEFGNRGTLGLTQAYPDYEVATEKVTHVRSALQFEAPNANFYKPKMFIDANGNFRIKGSSAGTDYFEMGSTGSNNNGGFEFIIGDDGDEPMVFKSYHYINGMSEIMRLQSGRMAVGSNAFDATNPEKLLIDAGTTTSYNLMTGKGSIDNYLQINVQNRSNGGSASSDIVATANNGSETDKFIDMGINSGGYTNVSSPILGGANTTYLYSTGNDMVIGNGTANMNLRFFTGGFANANERLRIDGAGDVGINNLNPAEKLDVTGNVRFSGALMPGGAAGTAGQILQSNGAGAAPTWVTSGLTTAWTQGGNNVASLQRFGTTSNYDLPIITNNTEAMRITTTNRVGIGTATPAEVLDVNGNIRIGGGNRRLTFATPGYDSDAMIEHRTYSGTEANELLFFVGNDNSGLYGPDRIRMVAEEFRFQTFNNGGNSTVANAESGTNANTRMLITDEGDVAIGGTTFNATNPEKLLVDAGTTTSFNVISGKGNINNYLQLNIQNNSAGSVASSDLVASANNGTETTGFVDLGINSSGFTDVTYPILGGANTTYLYGTGNDFVIGTGIANKNLRFFTGGFATANERMRIDGSGRVGIGTTSPSAPLSVEEAGGTVASFNRGNSGTVISIRRNGVEEGTISNTLGNVSYNAFTGSHYATTNQDIELGMLVTLTGKNQYLNNNSNSEIIYGIEKSSIPNDPKIMGAFLGLQESTKPAGTNNPNLVMAVGNGVMWVVDKGEDIAAGDFLISSDVPGHAMKDNGTYSTAFVIAKVAEPVNWSNETATINGVKHKLVSVFFESFIHNNAEKKLQTLQTEMNKLKEQIKLIEEKVNAIGK